MDRKVPPRMRYVMTQAPDAQRERSIAAGCKREEKEDGKSTASSMRHAANRPARRSGKKGRERVTLAPSLSIRLTCRTAAAALSFVFEACRLQLVRDRVSPSLFIVMCHASVSNTIELPVLHLPFFIVVCHVYHGTCALVHLDTVCFLFLHVPPSPADLCVSSTSLSPIRPLFSSILSSLLAFYTHTLPLCGYIFLFAIFSYVFPNSLLSTIRDARARKNSSRQLPKEQAWVYTDNARTGGMTKKKRQCALIRSPLSLAGGVADEATVLPPTVSRRLLDVVFFLLLFGHVLSFVVLRSSPLLLFAVAWLSSIVYSHPFSLVLSQRRHRSPCSPTTASLAFFGEGRGCPLLLSSFGLRHGFPVVLLCFRPSCVRQRCKWMTGSSCCGERRRAHAKGAENPPLAPNGMF